MSVPPPRTEPDPQPIDAPRPREAERWGLWMAPTAVVLGLGIGIVLQAIVSAVGAGTSSSTLQHPTPAVSLIGDLVTDLAFVLAAVWVVTRSRPPRRVRPNDFGFRRVTFGSAAGAVFLAAVSYYLVTLVYASVFRLHGSDKLPSELGVSKSTAALVGAAVFVCVVAPICEEFFFRGFLLRVLSGLRLTVRGHDEGKWVAAIIVGILFGLAHLGSASPQYLIPLGFLGFVLCALRIRTGSLYPGMALHSLNNSLALGVNSLHWSGAAILGLMIGSLAVITMLVGPLSGRGREVPAVT